MIMFQNPRTQNPNSHFGDRPANLVFGHGDPCHPINWIISRCHQALVPSQLQRDTGSCPPPGITTPWGMVEFSPHLPRRLARGSQDRHGPSAPDEGTPGCSLVLPAPTPLPMPSVVCGEADNPVSRWITRGIWGQEYRSAQLMPGSGAESHAASRVQILGSSFRDSSVFLALAQPSHVAATPNVAFF